MHIVIDAHLAVKKIDGVTRYLKGLLNALPGLDGSIQYTFLDLPRTLSGLPDSIFAPINVKRFELNLMGPSPRQHFLMRRMLREMGADLYHHPQYDLPVGLNLPTVVTVHDLKYIFHPEFLTSQSRLKRLYIRQSLRYSVRKCKRIITVSENTRRDLSRLFPRETDKMCMIHHGVDTPGTFEPANGTLGVSLPKRYILFVGTRRPHKNIEGLIKMLGILREQKQVDIDLVIAGKGYADYDGPEQAVKKIGVEKHTHFLDFVSEEHLPALYAGAELVALPSFYEGFGLPVVEAMAHGRPVISSNVTSLPEVLGDGGLLIDPHDPADMAEKAGRILTDEALSKQLSKNATIRAKAFSWNTVAEKTLSEYCLATSSKADEKASC